MKLVNRCFSIGPFYAVIAPQAGGSPLVDRANTTEKEGKLRRGTGYLIRLPFTGHRPTLGLNVGRWRKNVPRGESIQVTAPDQPK